MAVTAMGQSPQRVARSMLSDNSIRLVSADVSLELSECLILKSKSRREQCLHNSLTLRNLTRSSWCFQQTSVRDNVGLSEADIVLQPMDVISTEIFQKQKME